MGALPAGDGGTYFQSFGASRNILGLVEGSDPQLKEQVIVVGAHYDHVGYGRAEQQLRPARATSTTAPTTTPAASPACWKCSMP